MILLNIGVLAGTALGTWWLTGIDKTVSGESKRDRHLTRAVRCVAVSFLAAVYVWFVEQPGMGFAGIPFLLIIPVSIALILRSSVSELFTHGFIRFLDPTLHDDREFDLNKARRYQDTIAHLIHNGHRDEAIKLCEELKQSGELDIVTLENTLEFLGVKQNRAHVSKPLAEVRQLRLEGKFAEAEQRLKVMLAENPNHLEAALLLVRLYAQDLRRPSQAHEVLHALEKQPHVSAAHVEFARRSVDEWSRPRPAQIATAAPPAAESIDELLAQGFFGSAIERLEEQVKAQPQDFEPRLKLAEVFAVNCKDLQRAEKIIRQLDTADGFSPQQIESARTKLAGWRSAANHRPGMA
jgi:tetratricopeptide (TPR) repeat protein